MPLYSRIDTVRFYQNIDLTLILYIWENWHYHYHWSKPFQNCFWFWVLLSVFFHCFWFGWKNSTFLLHFLSFELHLADFFVIFLLQNNFVVSVWCLCKLFYCCFDIHCWCSVSLGLSWRTKTVFCWACFLITVSNEEQKVFFMISGFSARWNDLQFIFPTSREKAFLEYFVLSNLFFWCIHFYFKRFHQLK